MSLLSKRASWSLLWVSLALVAIAATCCQAAKKTKEELEFEAVRKAYNELFISSSSQSPAKVLDKLQLLTTVYGRPDLNMAIDYHLLLSFNQTEEAKCDSFEYMSKLKEVSQMVEREYRALRKYMRDCLDRQLKMCDFEQRFRDRFEAFKREQAGQWNLIQEFNTQAEYMGKRSKDWQTGALDNEIQMNEALERVARKVAKHGADPYINAYQVAVDIRSACSRFDSDLSSGLLMTTIEEKKKKNKETKEWYKLMSVCRQVGRVSFERSLGTIMGHTYMPEIQKGWEAYEEFAEKWLH